MNATWKAIRGFEGLYKVSDMGEIKSLCAGRYKTEMIRKPVPDKDGYLTVNLKKNSKYYCRKIHRLVAEAFIKNPYGLPQINHIDENKTNNSASNLEWCDSKYNNNYGKHASSSNKPVFKLDECGNVLSAYRSIKEAGRANAIDPTLISPVLTGKRKHAGGFRWAYQY